MSLLLNFFSFFQYFENSLITQVNNTSLRFNRVIRNRSLPFLWRTTIIFKWIFTDWVYFLNHSFLLWLPPKNSWIAFQKFIKFIKRFLHHVSLPWTTFMNLQNLAFNETFWVLIFWEILYLPFQIYIFFLWSLNFWIQIKLIRLIEINFIELLRKGRV